MPYVYYKVVDIRAYIYYNFVIRKTRFVTYNFLRFKICKKEQYVNLD